MPCSTRTLGTPNKHREDVESVEAAMGLLRGPGEDDCISSRSSCLIRACWQGQPEDKADKAKGSKSSICKVWLFGAVGVDEFP